MELSFQSSLVSVTFRVWLSFRFISFLNNLVAKRRILRKKELNHCTSQEPNGEKTRKEVSVLDVGEKPQSIIPEKTHGLPDCMDVVG